MSRLFTLVFFLYFFVATYGQSEIYELRAYEMEFFKPADVLHDYFQKALIPALNRQGINNVGAFEELGQALPKKIYLLIAYPDMNAHQKVADQLASDEQYMTDAASYMTAPSDQIPFKRMQTTFIRSTTGFAELVKPADNSEVFELRIYESYNEDALRRKVKMFNDSEFDIFKDVGHHMVFFGANISGDQMPCLTYLIASKDMAENKEAWSKFGPHPEWQRIVNLGEYAHAMNSITTDIFKTA